MKSDHASHFLHQVPMQMLMPSCFPCRFLLHLCHASDLQYTRLMNFPTKSIFQRFNPENITSGIPHFCSELCWVCSWPLPVVSSKSGHTRDTCLTGPPDEPVCPCLRDPKLVASMQKFETGQRYRLLRSSSKRVERCRLRTGQQKWTCATCETNSRMRIPRRRRWKRSKLDLAAQQPPITFSDRHLSVCLYQSSQRLRVWPRALTVSGLRRQELVPCSRMRVLQLTKILLVPSEKRTLAVTTPVGFFLMAPRDALIKFGRQQASSVSFSTCPRVD